MKAKRMTDSIYGSMPNIKSQSSVDSNSFHPQTGDIVRITIDHPITDSRVYGIWEEARAHQDFDNLSSAANQATYFEQQYAGAFKVRWCMASWSSFSLLPLPGGLGFIMSFTQYHVDIIAQVLHNPLPPLSEIIGICILIVVIAFVSYFIFVCNKIVEALGPLGALIVGGALFAIIVLIILLVLGGSASFTGKKRGFSIGKG